MISFAKLYSDVGVFVCSPIFFSCFQMSEVGLTETVHSGKGSDARKFELWLQGECLFPCICLFTSIDTGLHRVGG